MGAPPGILKIIEGYSIPFVVKPPFTPLTGVCLEKFTSRGLDAEIEVMISQNILEPCLSPLGYLSKLFPVLKPDGSFRPIINLRGLNRFLRPKKFRLLNHFRVPEFLQEGDYLSKIDISQAYFHLPIKLQHRKFLAIFHRHRILQFICLPFGLATALITFARVSNWLAGQLRERGIRLIVYLDDFLLANQHPNELEKDLIPPKALQECVWWLENLQKDRQIFASVETIFVTTDASDTGWGAQVNKRLLSGLWKTNQTLWHINRKELYAIYQTVLLTLTQLRGKRVVIQSDNKTAVSYIRNQGGTKSVLLTELVSKILELAYENKIEIFAYYIPEVFNEMADSLSRQKHLADWHLSNKVTDLLFKKWGTPQVDLFATAFSKVVPIYVSRDTTDKCALFIDAFSRIWDFDLAWIFPPPGLMPRVLAHLNKARGTYILVAPRWERVFWRADLRRRALDRPICIRNLQHHLSDATQNVPLPDARNLRLEAWLIRGGQKSHLHGPKKTLNYSKDLGESLL
ncbi:unnamed protein product [Parnassius mnemosyne]|uniref:Reverse transcriptase domain-containing protein n=1 Tax=Parnassius mnemosyne TaxID=213953 RepID=A0AAV1LW16_9NEOP